MEDTLQSQDIIVIHDICEICNDVVAVLRSGHIEDHYFNQDGVYRPCPGSGLIASAVVNISRKSNG